MMDRGRWGASDWSNDDKMTGPTGVMTTIIWTNKRNGDKIMTLDRHCYWRNGDRMPGPITGLLTG